MFDKLCSTASRESFDIESLLLRIERPQLRWLGHVSRMSQERLPKQTLYVEVSGKKLDGLPWPRSINYITKLGWNFLGLRQSEMQSVLVDWKIWQLNPQLRQRNPQRKAIEKKRRLFKIT